MPLQIIHRDLTSMHCDVLVTPTDSCYSGSGGTDAAIHASAGPELEAACRKLPRLSFGETRFTPGFALPCRYIIHTMGPVWSGGTHNEAALLRACYINALLLARSLGADSVAFPLISAGTFGFPKDRVMKLATDAISDFLLNADGELQVYLCVYSRSEYEPGMASALTDFLFRTVRFPMASDGVFPPCEAPKAHRNELFSREAEDADRRRASFPKKSARRTKHDRGDMAPSPDAWSASVPPDEELPYMEDIGEQERPSYDTIDDALSLGLSCDAIEYSLPLAESVPEPDTVLSYREESSADPAAPFFSRPAQTKRPGAAPMPEKLSDWLKRQDDSFAVTLMKLIDKKGMDDVACYKKANVTKNTFWKIRNSETYRPSKPTVLAFAIALELTMEETELLLRSAGFSLSRNNLFDMIIEFYISNGVYDIFEINAALYQYDQLCLGC